MVLFKVCLKGAFQVQGTSQVQDMSQVRCTSQINGTFQVQGTSQVGGTSHLKAKVVSRQGYVKETICFKARVKWLKSAVHFKAFLSRVNLRKKFYLKLNVISRVHFEARGCLVASLHPKSWVHLN